jgi:hypothetical protein
VIIAPAIVLTLLEPNAFTNCKIPIYMCTIFQIMFAGIMRYESVKKEIEHSSRLDVI